MKTLRFLVALFIVLGFTWNRVNAQSQKGEPYTQYWEFYIPCLDETLTGTCVLTNFTWDGTGRHLVKLDGILIGQTSHKEYSVTTNWDYIEVNPNSGYPPFYKWIQTLMVRDGNKLVAKIHQTFHAYFDENGEYIIQVDDYKIDCK
jgi:hypothetical protein